MIVSGASIAGSGGTADYEFAKRGLHENALTAMKRAVDTPDLVVDEPLRETGDTVDGAKIWSIESRSTDGEIVFLQGAVLDDAGALLVTLESPPSDSAVIFFHDFMRQVRKSGDETSQ